MNFTQSSALEQQFPRITEKIVLLWGYPEMDIFFERLAIDLRGDREGFPPDVMSELMWLSRLHASAYPQKSAMAPVNRRDAYQFAFA